MHWRRALSPRVLQASAKAGAGIGVNLQHFPVSSWFTWSVASYAHGGSGPDEDTDGT